jgi:hypothetical protein
MNVVVDQKQQTTNAEKGGGATTSAATTATTATTSTDNTVTAVADETTTTTTTPGSPTMTDLESQNHEETICNPYDYPSTKGKYSMSGDIQPPPSCCYKRQVGRFYVCMDRADANGVQVPCCMVGPCWPMMLMTMSLILGAGALSSGIFGQFLVKSTAGIVVLVVGLSFVVGVAICFGCTACRNPGIYPRQGKDTTGDMIWHEETKSWRPRRGVMMDSETRVLAYQIDHFCPWTGTLIARDNMCCFSSFTSFLLFACLGVGAICIYGLIAATETL